MIRVGLDSYLPPYAVKSKTKASQIGIAVKEKCSKCRKQIPNNEPTYTLKIKGEEKVFCMDCAREKLGKGKPI